MNIEINKCYNEDCLDTMARMPDNFIDLTVTSPPYDNLRTYNGYSFDFEAVAKELYRVTKHGGVVVWVVGDATIKGSETGTSFRQALFFKECGFNLHDTMIYQKANPMPLPSNRYNPSFEYMFVLSKRKPTTTNLLVEPCVSYGKKNKLAHRKGSNGVLENGTGFNKDIHSHKVRQNVWCILKDYVDVVDHPAKFPEALANDHILSWSNENDIVYDPFMGSGTTAKMAILNKRNWIGSEISEEYCQIIERRIDGIKLV